MLVFLSHEAASATPVSQKNAFCFRARTFADISRTFVDDAARGVCGHRRTFGGHYSSTNWAAGHASWVPRTSADTHFATFSRNFYEQSRFFLSGGHRRTFHTFVYNSADKDAFSVADISRTFIYCSFWSEFHAQADMFCISFAGFGLQIYNPDSGKHYSFLYATLQTCSRGATTATHAGGLGFRGGLWGGHHRPLTRNPGPIYIYIYIYIL